MRKFIISLIIFSFLFCCQSIFSQTSNWNVINIRQTITSIQSFDNIMRVFTSAPLFYNSINSGENIALVNTNYSPGVYYEYAGVNSSVCFINSNSGWATQRNNVILKTSNGGFNWTTLSTGSNYSFYSVFFVNELTGWITGKKSSPTNGVILKTVNGGNNWITQTTSLSTYPRSLYMVNENTGWMVLDIDTMLYTSNGGTNWLRKSTGIGQLLHDVYFSNSSTGWILGSGNSGYIIKTTNAGENWNTYTFSNPGNCISLYFIDSNTGWVTGRYGFITRTTNGGLNWILQRPYSGGSPYNDLSQIKFKNNNTGWAAGYDGRILATSNGGLNWYYKVDEPNGNLTSVVFKDSTTGWIAVNEGKILKSTNGGFNWSLQHLTGIQINDVKFLGDDKLIIVGNSGSIFYTSNGGVNWNLENIGTSNLNSANFLDNNTGWICGSSGNVLKTTNGGLNWIEINSGTTFNLTSICFTNLSSGFIATESGNILKTTNGGLNWISVLPLDRVWTNIKFINSNTGFIIGYKSYSGIPPSYDANLLKTTDAGNTWNTKLSITSHDGRYLTNIFFANNQTGWLCGNRGDIFKTTNSGENWFTENSKTTLGLSGIFFINSNLGWITGSNGTILTTGNINSGIKKMSSEIIPENFKLYQNYPNPFNAETKIRFEIQNSISTALRGNPVKLSVFDILGKEVATLVNESLLPGTYEITFSASTFTSGIYFYRLQTNKFTETKKLILLK